jgi:beta-glucosidase/6-phospho-beta-glucosidase/beta-galactosidase
MGAAAHVGRVGALAVALGVWGAIATGHGVALADTPDGSSSDSSTSSSAGATPPSGSTSDSAPAKPSEQAAPTPEAVDDDVTPSSTAPTPSTSVPTPTESAPVPEQPNKKSAHESAKNAPTATAKQAAVTAADPEPEPEPETVAAASPAAAEAEPVVALSATPTAMLVQTAAPVPAPSLTSNPISVATSYVAGIVTSLAQVLLNPFAAAGGLPALPDSPTPWALLAWVRREGLNQTPTVAYTPGDNQQTSGLVFGEVGGGDPDGDALTYTLVGSPVNGGRVVLDPEAGTFVYRPTNAMAEVGGTDRFTVVVSDEASGLHLHGPAGLLQFAPVAAPVLAVLQALPVIGPPISTLVAMLSKLPVIGDLLSPFGEHAVVATIEVAVAATPGQDLSFGPDFHWGVATGSFQGEMGGDAPNAVNSDEWVFLHDAINKLIGAAPGLPEDGPDGWDMYQTDAELAADGLGVDTFRTGIEWSRIFPNSTASVDASDGISPDELAALDGLADQDAVEHYRDVFLALRAQGLEPMVTINHFTLPTWLNNPTLAQRIALQLGVPGSESGWLNSDTVDEFQKYAAYVAWKYGDDVDTWLVLNEPTAYPFGGLLYIPGGPVPAFPPGVLRPDLMSTFLVNEANAYVAASKEIHLRDPGSQVGFTNSMSSFRPADPLNPLDQTAATAFTIFYNEWFPDAVIRGDVDANLDGVITPDEHHPEMAGSADFLGVNYYATGTIRGFGFPFLPGLPFAQGLPSRTYTAGNCPTDSCSTDTGQPIDPGGLREVLDVAASYDVPIWITENGIANSDDSQRSSYLVRHLAVVQDAIANDHMDIRGYVYWSLTDVLEWSNGYEDHFGLYSFDPITKERTPRPSVAVVKQLTDANGLPIALLPGYLASQT